MNRTYLHAQFPSTVGHKPLEKMLNDLVIEAKAELVDAAESAADWLSDATPNSDPWERGNRLRKALKAVRRGK